MNAAQMVEYMNEQWLIGTKGDDPAMVLSDVVHADISHIEGEWEPVPEETYDGTTLSGAPEDLEPGMSDGVVERAGVLYVRTNDSTVMGHFRFVRKDDPRTPAQHEAIEAADAAAKGADLPTYSLLLAALQNLTEACRKEKEPRPGAILAAEAVLGRVPG